jgi:hypothetical protein
MACREPAMSCSKSRPSWCSQPMEPFAARTHTPWPLPPSSTRQEATGDCPTGRCDGADLIPLARSCATLLQSGAPRLSFARRTVTVGHGRPASCLGCSIAGSAASAALLARRGASSSPSSLASTDRREQPNATNAARNKNGIRAAVCMVRALNFRNWWIRRQVERGSTIREGVVAVAGLGAPARRRHHLE